MHVREGGKVIRRDSFSLWKFKSCSNLGLIPQDSHLAATGEQIVTCKNSATYKNKDKLTHEKERQTGRWGGAERIIDIK